jgi:hypothetical protein
MTVCFRSHDLHGAYPTNLAGICLWLIETAKRHDMEVGTLTCMSMSAHIYARDWNDANEVISKHYVTNHEPRWDMRSTWRVEKIVEQVEGWKCPECNEPLPLTVPAHLPCWRVGGEVLRPSKFAPVKVDLAPRLRATALTPDGKEVIAVFEATTPEALRSQIERSGLISSVGSALWVGDEIRRVSEGK